LATDGSAAAPVAGRPPSRPPPGPRPTLEHVFSALGLLSFVALWWYGSRTQDFIPALGEVAEAVPDFLTEEDIWADIGPSLMRVLGGLAVGLALGASAAYLMARGRFWGQVVARYVDLAIGLPSTIVALLALFMFKRSETGVYLVVALACFPFFALTLKQGFAAADRRLTDMAEVYRFGAGRRLRHVLIPHLVPYTLSSIRNEYAHAWRVVVLAEIFAVNSGIGWRFSQAFDHFKLLDVSLWLLTFMVILLGTEYLVLRPIERLALRWRGR
jgi:NitT/TauT family transport system permease protein